MSPGRWYAIYRLKCPCDVCAQGRIAMVQARRDERKDTCEH